MKKQIIVVITGLLVSAAVIAQVPQQNQTQTQSGTRTQTQTRTQEAVQTQTQTQAGTMTQTRGQAGVQTQEQYKNQGQMTKAQKQARNAERKALKQQQKEMKKQEAAQNVFNTRSRIKLPHRTKVLVMLLLKEMQQEHREVRELAESRCLL